MPGRRHQTNTFAVVTLEASSLRNACSIQETQVRPEDHGSLHQGAQERFPDELIDQNHVRGVGRAAAKAEARRDEGVCRASEVCRAIHNRHYHQFSSVRVLTQPDVVGPEIVVCRRTRDECDGAAVEGGLDDVPDKCGHSAEGVGQLEGRDI